MRSSIFFLFSLSASGVQASWFGSDPPYTSWSKDKLQQWLAEHDIKASSTYSPSQLQEIVKSNWITATPSFQYLKDESFSSWDDSRLREFLLEQGVVAPSGPRDQLVLLAKQKYTAYTNAVSSISADASNTVGSVVSSASSVVVTAAAQATKDIVRKLDDSKDYVYSSWDDSKMKKLLQDKGMEPATGLTRQQLLKKMREVYANADPIWDTWSDSYMVSLFPASFCIISLTLFQREWLFSHNLIPESYDAKRASYAQMLKSYHYSLSDTLWSSWTDSKLKAWLVTNGYMQSNQEIRREKMVQLVSDNYTSARDTFWSAWSDSDIRNWLIENGYIRFDAQAKRNELVKLINDKYADASARTSVYLSWPDSRLRVYLRERGVSEKALPTSRPGLLRETRIRWVQTTSRADALYRTICDLIKSGVTSAQDTLCHILELLWSMSDQSKQYVSEKAAQGKEYVESAREKTSDKIKHGEEGEL